MAGLDGTLTVELTLPKPKNALVKIVLQLHQCEHGVCVTNPKTGWVLFLDARHDIFTHPWQHVFQFNHDFVTKASLHVKIQRRQELFSEMSAPGTVDLQGMVMNFLCVRYKIEPKE